MTWLIELALNNTRAVTVAMLSLVLIGSLCLWLSLISTDFQSVQHSSCHAGTILADG